MRTLLLLFIYLFSITALSHESRPVYLEINEIESLVYKTIWKNPEGGIMRGKLYPIFPKDCQTKVIASANYSHASVRKQILKCATSIAGRKITINDLNLNLGISALIRVSFLSKESHSKIIKSSNPEYIVPLQENKWTIIKSYTLLGIEHILLGIDHLLFILCLLLIISNRKMLFLTITGFTLAHSLTLFASVFNLVRLPSPFVEACIALSIIFLAAEIARGNKKTLTYQKPFLVSSLFGLLHGFGFADVLIELGLPQTELSLGLFFFNVGVEIGQILFILFSLLLAQSYHFLVKNFFSAQKHKNLPTEHFVSYIIGTIAVFWMFQRLQGF